MVKDGSWANGGSCASARCEGEGSVSCIVSVDVFDASGASRRAFGGVEEG
jgi:hypothetical protein